MIVGIVLSSVVLWLKPDALAAKVWIALFGSILAMWLGAYALDWW